MCRFPFTLPFHYSCDHDLQTARRKILTIDSTKRDRLDHSPSATETLHAHLNAVNQLGPADAPNVGS